jgi:protein disulfide-isomerase A6
MAALRVALLSAALSGASAGAVELTASNYKDLVEGSGKAAFVKFLAPW